MRKCGYCGGMLSQVIGLYVTSKGVRVPGVKYDKCKKCGMKYLDHESYLKVERAIRALGVSRCKIVHRK